MLLAAYGGPPFQIYQYTIVVLSVLRELSGRNLCYSVLVFGGQSTQRAAQAELKWLRMDLISTGAMWIHVLPETRRHVRLDRARTVAAPQLLAWVEDLFHCPLERTRRIIAVVAQICARIIPVAIAAQAPLDRPHSWRQLWLGCNGLVPGHARRCHLAQGRLHLRRHDIR